MGGCNSDIQTDTVGSKHGVVSCKQCKCGSDRFRFLSGAAIFRGHSIQNSTSLPVIVYVCVRSVLNIFIINNIEHGVEVIAAMKVNDSSSRVRSPVLSFLPILAAS